MGISLMGSAGRTDAPLAGDPNPLLFKVEDEEVVCGQSILLVRYAGCTTFNGLKLLLLRRRWARVDAVTPLDPHLLGGAHIVAARFEPTLLGLAQALAAPAFRSMNENNPAGLISVLGEMLQQRFAPEENVINPEP